ncbi:trypsin-like serine peptidase [Streptomyces sp. NPDC020801]|uniref:trypsin-like serine peptidase n=1 Tax=unclassified Streptomyces TaxID=2593676 RepID=UPI00378C5F24
MTVVAALCAAVLGATVPAAWAAPPSPRPSSPSPTPPAAAPSAAPSPAAGQEARKAAEYWTAQRMAGARPLDGPRAEPSGPKQGATAVAGVAKGTLFGGTRLVGTFFGSSGPNGADWTCTGSVLDTPARNVILTAGHCGLGIRNNYIFVPKFLKGAGPDQQPYGIFHIQRVFIDPRYVPDQGASTTKKAWSDLDTAFARVSANQRGQQLQDAVGGGLTFTQPAGYSNKSVTVVGYPARKHGNDAGQAIKCTVPTTQLSGYRQMSMTCGGYYGGVSGSPWITDYQDDAGTGHVIGNLGGYNGGGNDANVDYISYAPAFGTDAANLLANAVADQDPPGDLPPYQGIQAKLPNGAGIWQHARLLTSGDYTGDHLSDMIVVWSDGEVTLYPGDGKGGYLTETRLRPPNSTWTQAATITGGDFAGTDLFDLVVRWPSGKVSLYPDVSPSGISKEIQLAPPGSDWKNAVQISAGQFHNGKYVTDLLVRWTSGELTLHTNVGAGTFGTRHRLAAPNSDWKNATLLTTGDFSHHTNWDVLARQPDGELDTYVATSSAGLGAKTRIRGPNGLWTHASVLTAGNYTSSNLNDDLVVRWSDGETTMYTDTTSDALGTENTLVPAGT